ncbi:MAG: S8 family serine peptidase [Prevotella sp.]|nr:S8 family serine peptidase [Prevotella sp.]
MKRIYYDKDGRVKNPHFPFWKPWTLWGMIWRTLLFLSGLILIAILLGLLIRGCSEKGQNWSNPFHDDGDGYQPDPQLPDSLKDGTPVKDWGTPLPDMDELPAPDDNVIPPVNPDSTITDPKDSLAQIVPDQLVVFFNSSDVKEDIVKFAKEFKKLWPDPQYKVAYYNQQAGTMLLSVPKEQRDKVAEEIVQKITGIDFLLTTNEMLESGQQQYQPQDPAFKEQRYMAYYKLIQAPEAWQITRGAKDVKVAIVDSYFALNHKDLSERYVDPIHIASKTTAVFPPAGVDPAIASHGSHVAGIAIGTAGNGQGAHGIAPECTWIPISVATGGSITAFNLMEGILYAIYRGADVVNLSIGRAFPDGVDKTPLGDQVQATSLSKVKQQIWDYIYKVAADHKTIICTAAGNSNILMGIDPGKRNNELVVKVEAVDSKGQKAEFSNFGEVPEAQLRYSTVAAPGVGIHSCVANGGYDDWPGTSMASPFVAGAVALMKTLKKDLTPQEAIKILKATAKQTDTQHRIGPTIQIKDALMECGEGEMLNFDDLMKDHTLLIGRWKSTHELEIVDNDNKKVDDIWTYFIFNATDKGTVENKTINLSRTYTAPLSVTWDTNSLTIRQLDVAKSNDGHTLTKDEYLCRPDENRLLQVSVMRDGKERYNFHMEKVE